MNVIVEDDDDRTPDISGAGDAARTGAAVRLLDTDGWIDRNAVIAAGAVTKLKKPEVLMPPQPGGGEAAAAAGYPGLAADPMMLKKRSFTLSGHRTSVALEAEFWAVLEIAQRRETAKPGGAGGPN